LTKRKKSGIISVSSPSGKPIGEDEKDICIQRYDEVRFVFYRRPDSIGLFRIGPDKRRQREYRPWLKGGIGVKTILFPSERRAENAYPCRFAKHGFSGTGAAAK